MEFWYAATGPYHWLKLHETHMQNQPLFIPAVAANGANFQQGMNGNFEPIQLYRFIVPRNAMNVVLNTFAPYKGKSTGVNIMTATLRKALGLLPIPEHQQTAVKLNASFDYLNIIPIGIKDDGEDRVMFPTGTKQEPI